MKLIEQIKEPSFAYLTKAISEEAKCAGSFISYPDIDFNALLYPINGSVGVQPTQFVQRITLSPSEEAANWIFYDSVMLKWQGYKDYCVLIDK